MMVDRFILATLILATTILIARIVRGWHGRRVRRILDSSPTLTSMAGMPRVLAFTGPGCAQCQQQSQILAALLNESTPLFELQSLNAAAEQSLARQFGVLIVPTTVVASPDGQVRAINAGLTSAQRLRDQLTSF